MSEIAGPPDEARADTSHALTEGPDAAIERMQVVADLLDASFRVPGTDFRFGIDPVIGLLPGVGDTLTAGLSLYIVVEAARLGVPAWTLARMLGNIAIDAVVGAVPLVGDLFDARFKANRRNVALARRALASTPDAAPDAT